MASDLSFVEYVRDQMQGAGAVTFKKMFGEYALYVDEKVVALVCDNQLFVKPTVAGRALLGTVTEGLPYPGAKPQFLITEQLEDQGLIAELMRATAAELPRPKPKPAKKAAPNRSRGSRGQSR
jgi:TfoX/Sxy family transcriptional regulator of competence genes